VLATITFAEQVLAEPVPLRCPRACQETHYSVPVTNSRANSPVNCPTLILLVSYVRMDYTRRKSGNLFNIACAIAGPVILYLELRSPHRFYYQQNKVFALFGAACGLFVVVLMIFNRKSQRYWQEWRRSLGLACLLSVLILTPIGLLIAQWTSMKLQGKETTNGLIVRVKSWSSYRRLGRWHEYREVYVLVGSRTIRRFDLGENLDVFTHARLGQTISISHYPWIRDEFLEIELK